MEPRIKNTKIQNTNIKLGPTTIGPLGGSVAVNCDMVKVNVPMGSSIFFFQAEGSL
jgi:hypothetical protein